MQFSAKVSIYLFTKQKSIIKSIINTIIKHNKRNKTVFFLRFFGESKTGKKQKRIEPQPKWRGDRDRVSTLINF